MNLKKIFTIFLRVGISIVLLAYLFKQTDEKALFNIVRNSDKALLVTAFFVFSLNYILCLFRWKMLLEAAKINLSLKRVIISFAGGTFFNLFLPSTIGGDFVRSVDLAIHTKRPREIIATVLLDRLSGYIGLVVVALVATLLGFKLIAEKGVFLSVGLITLILVLVLVVLFNKTVYSKINKFLHSARVGGIKESIKNLHHEMHIFRHKQDIILSNLVLSLLVQIISPVSFYIIALSLDVKVNILYFFIFMPIITAITLLPISIGGLGIRDTSTILFFAQAGIGKNTAFAMSLISFSFILICGILGGLIYVLTVRHRRLQHHK